MFVPRRFLSSAFVPLLVGAGLAAVDTGHAEGLGSPDSSEGRAAAVVGTGESSVLTLIRELTVWKERAIRAEALLSRAGVSGAEGEPSVPSTNVGSAASVVGSLEAERMLILSLGSNRGALQGALVSIGRGVVAKIVESRETVSAALVDNSYKGRLATLEGLPVQLAVR